MGTLVTGEASRVRGSPLKKALRKIVPKILVQERGLPAAESSCLRESGLSFEAPGKTTALDLISLYQLWPSMLQRDGRKTPSK